MRPAYSYAGAGFYKSSTMLVSDDRLLPLAGETEAEQIADAQAKIQAYGILWEQNDLQFTHNLAQIPLGVTVTYANAHGRFSVADNLCG